MTNNTELRYGEVYECIKYSPLRTLCYVGKSNNPKRVLRHTAISRTPDNHSVYIYKFKEYNLNGRKLGLEGNMLVSQIRDKTIQRWAKNLLESKGL